MRRRLVVLIVVIAIVAFVIVQFVRPIPSVHTAPVPASGTVSTTVQGSTTAITWPTQGEAALGAMGAGVLGSSGTQSPTPLASVTKMMTAYVILHDHPLAAGVTGSEIPITATDVTEYQHDVTVGDSVVPVQTGEQLTELQALEALLLPSGDNIADLLANWDAGSLAAFVTKMNVQARALGLTSTHYADASGVSPTTTSTATDQVQLAIAAMALPVFRSVVAMPQATLPVAGVQYNVNALLGTDNIIGVKTGFTSAAGGCYVFAATSTVGGKSATVIGAVLHQVGGSSQSEDLQTAFDAAKTLLATSASALAATEVIKAGTALGVVSAPWAHDVGVEASKSVDVIAIPGESIKTTVTLDHLSAPIHDHQVVGTATVVVGSQTIHVPLVTSDSLESASLRWRLTNV